MSDLTNKEFQFQKVRLWEVIDKERKSAILNFNSKRCDYELDKSEKYKWNLQISIPKGAIMSAEQIAFSKCNVLFQFQKVRLWEKIEEHLNIL